MGKAKKKAQKKAKKKSAKRTVTKADVMSWVLGQKGRPHSDKEHHLLGTMEGALRKL